MLGEVRDSLALIMLLTRFIVTATDDLRVTTSLNQTKSTSPLKYLNAEIDVALYIKLIGFHLKVFLIDDVNYLS